MGVANGFVEAACNPLVASIFPDNKTEKLNQFHVWFPGGIVIGGLAAFGMDWLNLNWQWQLASIYLPTIFYGLLFFNQKFPETERVTSGISSAEMYKECKRPLFIFMVICMLFTAATELGTNQWIVELLASLDVPSILLLVFINGLMAFGRSFAGTIEEKISSAGMLLFSAVLSTFGLILLSKSSGIFSFGAAAIFAFGICFFWPTMLGFVSEKLPKTGAVGLSVMGAAGMLSVSLVLPFMGKVFDAERSNSLKILADSLPSAEAAIQANLSAGSSTLLYVSVLPAVLTIAFTFLYVKNKKVTKNSPMTPELANNM